MEASKLVADLDTEMSAISERLNALVAQRNEIDSQQLQPCISLLAPIRRLPREILQQIFWHCELTLHVYHQHDDDRNKYDWFPRSDIITLSHVCGAWR